MQVTGNNSNNLSVQVSLNGFSYETDGCARSEWLGAGRIFTLPEFRCKYDEVDISVFTPKFTLVPESLFNEETARDLLSIAVSLPGDSKVEYAPVPYFGAVVVYSMDIGESLSSTLKGILARKDGKELFAFPEIVFMLARLNSLNEYNKILASYDGIHLYLAVAQGDKLILSTAFEASDFTTAEYWIFLSLKKLQINPEVSTVYFRTNLSELREMSLCNYFKSVEVL